MIARDSKEAPLMKNLMNRILSMAFALILLTLCAAPAAQAYSYYDNYPQYVVESYSPNGYCYQYDKPSDIKGRNLGRHNNGEIVKVIDWDADKNFAYVICSNGKVGYIRKTSLVPNMQVKERNLWRVYSVEPNGYCYMYDQPSDIEGINLGRYDNGAYMEMIDYYADEVYAKVYSVTDEKYGYIRKDCLVFEDDYKPVQFYVYVYSTSPKGYCYMYNQPSSVTGKNMGRYNNGAKVGVIDWYADDEYALVESGDGKIGYIRKNQLTY